MRPRTIATQQIEAMRKAAAEVWKQFESQVPAEDRKEWRKLCKRHCGLWFGKQWG